MFSIPTYQVSTVGLLWIIFFSVSFRNGLVISALGQAQWSASLINWASQASEKSCLKQWRKTPKKEFSRLPSILCIHSIHEHTHKKIHASTHEHRHRGSMHEQINLQNDALGCQFRNVHHMLGEPTKVPQSEPYFSKSSRRGVRKVGTHMWDSWRQTKRGGWIGILSEHSDLF